MTSLIEAATLIQNFEQGSLATRISDLEASFHLKNRNDCISFFSSGDIQSPLLEAALFMKQAAGQVNVLIHAVGILLSLPHILQDGEVVESLSLGAGNTGRAFDLETDRRIAEFKFITWKGGPESIRQNSLFKDFYMMAEYETKKEKYLYVIGTQHPLKFFQGGRALSSVLSRNNKLSKEFENRYGNRFDKVCEYYNFKKSSVTLVDLKRILPQFATQLEIADQNAEVVGL